MNTFFELNRLVVPFAAPFLMQQANLPADTKCYIHDANTRECIVYVSQQQRAYYNSKGQQIPDPLQPLYSRS